jgi:lysophospholipase L1-like esterase
MSFPHHSPSSNDNPGAGHSSKPPAPDGILDGPEYVEHVELAVQDERVISLPSDARRRLLAIAFTFAALLGATYVIPGARNYRPWQPGEGYVPFWNVVGRELLGEGRAAEQQAAETDTLVRLAKIPDQPGQGVDETSQANAATPRAPIEQAVRGKFPTYQPQGTELEPPKVMIEGVAALEPYYRQLTLVQMGVPNTVARAAMWGDSVLGNDGITHALRRRMQPRFGDSGHGFMALGRYNPAYFHQGIRFQDKGGWRRCEIIFKCEDDGRYGYAGVTSTSSGGGESWFSATKQGLGSHTSRFELWYAKLPAGGRFQIKVDGVPTRIVNTASDVVGDGVEVVQVQDGYHEFEVRAIGVGATRGYGVVLERETPGVVWDSLGLIGAFTQRLDYQEPVHFAGQIAARNPDLLTFILGGNDVQREKMDLVHSMDRYEAEYTRVIRKFRAGKPAASCLILALVDHGERVGPHEIQTRRIVPRLVESQRRVALSEGCAFFDTFTAMGGPGSIGRWYRASPQLAGADFAHPTQAGHEVVAALFHHALMYGYAQYRAAKTGEPLPESSRLGLDPASNTAP